MRSWSRREWVAGGALLAAGCASSGGGSKPAPEQASGPMRNLFYLGASDVFALLPEGGAPVSLIEKMPDPTGRGGINDGIALLRSTGHIYWTNMGRPSERDGALYRCDIDGRNVETIVPSGQTHTPKQMKIDEAGGKLYWSDREGMAVMRCNLDGSKLETIVTTGNPVTSKGDQALWCVGLALDPVRRQFYWTQKGGDNAGQGLIRRAGMDMPAGARANTRTDIETLFARLPEPIDLEIREDTRQIYWTDRGDNTVSRATMDAGKNFVPGMRTDREILVRGLDEVIGLSLDLERGRMAYTSLGGEVGIANLDGSNAQLIATDQGLLTGITWGL